MARNRMGSRRIYEGLRDQILAGAYTHGSALPSSRALALELGVARSTVTVAYEQLLAEGFIVARRGARPRVASASAGVPTPTASASAGHAVELSDFGERMRELATPWEEGKSAVPFDFRYGELNPGDFPYLTWKRAMNAALEPRAEPLAYGDPRGSRRLRMALQGYLWRARAVQADSGQIIVVNGSQQGLDICARLLLGPDDSFVIEDPCYVAARQIFASTGASHLAIPADREGLDTGRLRNVKARLAYVTPSHQFPLGGVMPMRRRNELLDWADRQQAFVLEDDYDSEFRYDINPVPPLYALRNTTNVIYLGTVSKTLSPTLRLGYLVVPPELGHVFAAAKQLTDRHTPLAEQEALASLIESGAYERHIRRLRRAYGERRRALLKALMCSFGSIAIEGANAGLHIMLWFNGLTHAHEPRLIEEARFRGVGVYPVSRLYEPGSAALPAGRLGLVLGYAALDVPEIEQGVRLLADAVAALSAN